MQLVYTYGADYCGSTLLDRLFWNLPGVAAPGELHWLFDAPQRGSIPTCGQHEVSRCCTVHGDSCPQLGRPWVEQQFDLCFLYERVAKRLKAPTLVVSDKNWFHYRRSTMHCSREKIIVLFKSPMAYAWSRKRHEGTSIATSLHDWLRVYVDTIPHQCALVSYERLALQPNEIMGRISRWLGLPGWTKIDPETYLIDQDYHHIGGNPDAKQDKPITVDTGWRNGLDALDKATISLGNTVNLAYTNLCKESL